MELLSQRGQENRYRSIKYRSASTQITTKSIISTKMREQSLSISKNKNNQFSSRSSKFLTLSLPNCLNSKNQKPYFSNTKNSQYFKNNIKSKNNQEEDDLKNQKYLQTFQTLMASQNCKKVDYCKLGNVANKLIKMKTKFKQSRINLPILAQSQNSKFTVLDPIKLPIQYIESQINTAKTDLIKASKQMKEIKSNLHSIIQNIEKQLQQIMEISKVGIVQFQKVLKQNKVQQQQSNLKVNRNLGQLTQFVQQFKQSFTSTINSQLKIQEDIFSNRPFQLSIAQEDISQLENQQTSQKRQQKDKKLIYF